ncbi:uncharacterized protein J8A68_003730 [[Candida] subhashii]|uniref:HRQ family protein n=1 Tax=[Candida] subhashii TaxID=561895 RepID=A0A8J5QGP3_9ASCO|nr:uncharacterized protein J8A68_003730 [[Candida] subhashii]KAG7662742.1 hypothetical protein J8A68_003730 [[Candida] subhashii]
MIQLLILAVIVAAVGALYYVTRSTKEPTIFHHVSAVPPDYHWSKEEPLPIRPFVNKKNFNPSMGVKNLGKTPEDWLLIENSYVHKTNLKRKTLEAHSDQITHIHKNKVTIEALKEFYEVTTQFLLDKYPQHFKYSRWSGMVHNQINQDTFPKHSTKLSPEEMLHILATNLEEDFLILIKDNPQDADEEYILRGAVSGFPTGFDPSKLFNKPVSAIHIPVPQYKPRLQFSMHKFFNNLKTTDLWVRHNWSIQTQGTYFNLGALHGRPGEKIEKMKYEDIDFEGGGGDGDDRMGCCLRVERQCFVRLPISKAMIMTIRTYLTPIKKVKEEGLGPDLSFAIDSLPDDLAYYKRRDAWGEAVKEYLAK